MAENDIHDLAAGLIESEPLMVIGRAVAAGGQKVQDAWDTIQSHLSDLASKAKPAAASAVNTVTQALTPTAQAQTATPQPAAQSAQRSGATWTAQEFAQQVKKQYPEYQDWSDQELVTAMLQKYPEYKNQVETPTDPNWRQALGKGQVIFSNKVLAGARENLPAIGGTVGQMVQGPAGAAAGGMVGERLREYARAATGVEPLPGQLDASGRVLKQGAIQGGIALGSELLGKGLEKAGTAVYRSYLKPSLAAANIRNADEVVQTAIDEALPISRGGEGKAQALISRLKAQVTAIQKASPATTDLHDVADQLRMWATKSFYKPGVPTSDFDAAMKVADTIDQHASLGLRAGAASIPASQVEAQAVKEGLQARGASASLLDSAATKQAQEAGGHFMRTAMEQATPAIAPLNARESKLIDAAAAINRAVQRESNQYRIHGGKALVSMMVGGEESARTGDPWSAALKGLVVYGALQPEVATRAAIVASRLGRMSGIAPASAARIAIAAVTAPSASEAGQQ